MRTRSRVRLVLLAIVAIISLLFQLGGTTSARAGSVSVPAIQAGAEIRREVTATLGEPAESNKQPKPASWFTQDPSREPTLALPPAAPDAPKGPVDETLPTRDLSSWGALMSETFESDWPRAGWNVFDGDGTNHGEYYWDDDDFKPHAGTWSAWAANGGKDGIDPQSYNYPNYLDSWMVYGPFDLSGCADGEYEFYYWNRSEASYDEFNWYASNDGVNFRGFAVSGDSGGWQHVDMDLRPYLGDPSVWLAFRFFSDYSVTDIGPFVDDVALWCYAQTTVDPWTFMVYLDGDNNLEAAAVGDFLEMSTVGSSADVNILVQMDRITGYNTGYGDWTDTRRFHITSGMQPTQANSFTSLGEANMGDPQTLLNFVRWAKAYAPANHYALVFWGPGEGWKGGIAFDDSSSQDGLDMLELRNALGTLTANGAHPFDIVGLDADMMAMTEVDHQIRPFASYRVGSEEIRPDDGWPYNTVLASLVANPSMSAAALATNVVDLYYSSYGNNQTQSAVNLGTSYATLTSAVNTFANALSSNGANWIAQIRAARSYSQEFADPSYVDLWDFADYIELYVTDPAIHTAAGAVKSAVAAAVVHEHHGAAWPWARGISIYFPRTATGYDARYDGSTGFLRFTANTAWDEWVHMYHNFANYPAMFEKSGPADGAVDQTVSLTLSWDPSNRATSYETCVDTTNDGACSTSWVSRGANTSASVNLQGSTTYYWQVRARNAAGTVYANKGVWWSFRTGDLPAAFDKIAPSNGAAQQPLALTLHWWASGNFYHYDYCLDTINDNSCNTGWIDNGGAQDAAITGLSQGTTYYWQVRAVNTIGAVYADEGTWWSFKTIAMPGIFSKISPVDAAPNQSLDPVLGWESSSDAAGYEYCVDQVSNSACDDVWIDNGGGTSAQLNNLDLATTYYWQVRAYNSLGTRYADAGGWWSFTTGDVPGPFGKSTPVDGAIDQSPRPTLTWSASDGATGYSVCYDTIINADCDTTWIDVSGSSINLTGLPLSTLHEWQVIARNSFGETEADSGTWWSFTTVAPTQVTFLSTGTQDGWVRESAEDTSQGGAINASGVLLLVGDTASDQQLRSILSFNTAALPDGAVITKVTLHLKKAAVVGTNPFTTHGNIRVDVRRGPFAGSAALQVLDFQAAASRNAALTITNVPPVPVGGWYSRSMGAASFVYINKTGLTQFRLRFNLDDNDDLNADQIKFHSGNAVNAADQPKLVIEYYMP